MKIRGFYIREYGIIRNQNILDLHDGLVVIGGLNRAGKSTFRSLVRHLGYGFPGERLRPDLTADLQCDQTEVRLQVSGFGRPAVALAQGGKGSCPSLTEVYGGLDSFSYGQLFSISLEELQQQPPSLDKRQLGQLQAVLLGAGLADIVHIPQIERELSAAAEKIGGRLGNPMVKGFKVYSEQIRQGVELCRRAGEQFDDYKEAQLELEENKRAQQQQSRQLQEIDQRLQLLRSLRAMYPQWVEKKSLEQELKNGVATVELRFLPELEQLAARYEDSLLQLREAEDAFKEVIGYVSSAQALAALLEEGEAIEAQCLQLSGLIERVKGCLQLEEEIRSARQELNQSASAFNGAWSTTWSQIEQVAVDGVHQRMLSDAVAEYQRLHARITEERSAAAELEVALGMLAEGERKESERGPWLLLFTGTAVSAVLYGISWVAVALVGFTGTIVSAGVWRVFLHVQRIHHNRQILRLQSAMDRRKKTMLELQSSLQRLEEEQFLPLRRQLALDPAAPPQVVLDSAVFAQQLQQKATGLKIQQERLNEERQRLKASLEQAAELLQRTMGLSLQPALTAGEAFVAAFAQARDALERGRVYAAVEKEVHEQEQRMSQLLGQPVFRGQQQGFVSDSIRQTRNKQRLTALLQALSRRSDLEEVSSMHELEQLYCQFEDEAEIVAEYDRLRVDRKRCQEQLGILQQSSTELKQRLKQLQAVEGLQRGRDMIHDGRRQLLPLAETYGVQRTAQLLLQHLRQRFIRQAGDSLLHQASEIFRQLTNGSYQKLALKQDLLQPGFLVKTGTGLPGDATVLSQATQEQLFLSVRLSRILAIEPPLPVVFDDSLVNFDRQHEMDAVRLLGELAKRNQVFVLTCHPQFIETIRAAGQQAQYWRLCRGQFDRTDADMLVQHLKGG